MNNVIDARFRFTMARASAVAKREGAQAIEIDIDTLDAELRAAMADGRGFDMPTCEPYDRGPGC